jgi:hypothetical protein
VQLQQKRAKRKSGEDMQNSPEHCNLHRWCPLAVVSRRRSPVFIVDRRGVGAGGPASLYLLCLRDYIRGSSETPRGEVARGR